MTKVSESIYRVLNALKTANNADLIERWSIEMETQVNSAQDDGEPVAGKRNTFADDEFEWCSFRVPKHANAEPEFRDWMLRWPLDLHVEAIGMTGWNWTTRRSLWVAFDFDALIAHAKGIGLSEEELKRVLEVAMSLGYAEIRKSTGGSGLHIYVYFGDDGIPTENHTIHAALARCVLAMMSRDTGFDFTSRIDCCGGNMWVYHRKITVENEGLKIIKPCEKKLYLPDLPSDWREQVEVVARRQAKVRVDTGIQDDSLDPFDDFTSVYRRIPLDEMHKQIIDELAQSGFTTVWLPDHHLCQTHTVALKQLMETGKYEGVFDTISKGNNPGAPNCYWFPEANGVLHVYRFSPGVAEAETWQQDNEGWTNCRFNWPPDLTKSVTVTDTEEGSLATDATTDCNRSRPGDQ